MQTRTVAVELMEQGSITVHWDDLMDAARASIPDCDDQTLCRIAKGLRSETLQAWAIWCAERVHAVMITQAAVRDIHIVALRGNDLTLEDWQSAISAFCEFLRPYGIKRIVAITAVPRIIEIISSDGWRTKTYCEKDI
jgi:hypothetical protein